MNFFTKETCLELIQVLTDDQLYRECARYLKLAKKADTLKNSDSQRKYLLNRAAKIVDSNDINAIIQTSFDITKLRLRKVIEN